MLEKIEKIFREHTGDDTLVITKDTTFDELGLDSLDTVELIMTLEEEFSITVDEDNPIKSIAELLALIGE
jgi:acyl carrier protein